MKEITLKRVERGDELQVWLGAWVMSSESKATQRARRGDLKQLMEWLGDAELLLSITGVEALAFYKWLRTRPGVKPRGVNIGVRKAGLPSTEIRDEPHYLYAPATLQRKVNNLRAFYNYLKAIPGCPVEINPFSKVFVKAPTKVSSDKQPTEALSPREVKVLFATCNLGESMGKRNSCILAALFYCGLRVHEVAGLNVGGVVMNTSHPYLILPKSKGRDDIVRQPLPAGAIPHFKRWLRVREWHKAHDYEPLFIPRQGQGEFLAKRMSSETIRALVVRLGKKSGVERHISSHTGRATAITQLLRRKDEGGCGMSPQDVLKFSRHADIRMVMRYYKELYGLESNVGYELKY